MKKLWQILVPTHDRFGDEIPLDYHRGWDTYVRGKAGGLTVFKPSSGQWVSPDGILFHEKMIPVLICCTEGEILQIADYTAGYYSQEAVMYWLVSEQVVVRHYK
jgi:hypothetical protein